jgi:predicted amidophosphoribosyltransferase
VELVRDLLLIGGGVVFAGCVVLAWRRARERRRRWRQDLCPGCGYDVRGNSERCPECGRPIDRYPRDSGTFVIPDERTAGQ